MIYSDLVQQCYTAIEQSTALLAAALLTLSGIVTFGVWLLRSISASGRG